MKDAYLQISHLDVEFPTKDGSFTALKDVSLDVHEGEFISIIGHSGCGKSTVMNVIAGLTEGTRGGALVNGREVSGPGPDRALVFQNHSLLPWLTVWQNVELAVDVVFKKSKTRAERRDWIAHNLALVDMSHAHDKRPAEISGGMKQRVGIARALAMEPKVLLMDEPFGALDALTRAQLQDALMGIHSKLMNIVVMITHDIDEAVLLSDRIVMMTNGPAATIGEIETVELQRPRDRLALANNPVYNQKRESLLRFLYEKQRKVETLAASKVNANAVDAEVSDDERAGASRGVA